MAAVADLDVVAINDFGPDPAVFDRGQAQAQHGVEVSDRLSRLEQAGCRPGDGGAELAEDLSLASENRLLAVQDYALLLLQLRGQVALGAGQCLLALVAVGDG